MRATRPRHAHDDHEEEVVSINGAPAHQPELGESLATPASGDRGGRGPGADSPVEVVYVERAYARRSSVAWGDGL